MRIVTLAFLATAACAQTIVTPASVNQSEPAGVLRCKIKPIAPRLNFSLRFQAGYVVRVPLVQFRGSGHSYQMTLRVEPQGGGPPVFLQGYFDLPEVPKTDMQAQSAGSFLLGEGKYEAALVVRDDLDRGCRRQWTIEAKLRVRELAAKVPIPRGRVAELSEAGLSQTESDGGGGPRITVFLHAAPVRPGTGTVPPEDVELLLGAVSSLMRQAGVKSVRMVAFNLDQQREIYRGEQFRLCELDDVAAAIYRLQLALVDYKSLQGSSPQDLLLSLVRRELRDASRVDAVVFLGPRGRTASTFQKGMIQPPPEGPRFFYLEYQPQVDRREQVIKELLAERGRPGPELIASDPHQRPAVNRDPETELGTLGPQPASQGHPDLIERAVQELKGKTFVVHEAREFVHAIEQIRQVK
jgi:hypothetical protein